VNCIMRTSAFLVMSLRAPTREPSAAHLQDPDLLSLVNKHLPASELGPASLAESWDCTPVMSVAAPPLHERPWLIAALGGAGIKAATSCHDPVSGSRRAARAA